MHSITGLPCTPSQDYHALHHRITMHSITGLPCTPSQDYHALHHRITMHSITGLPCTPSQDTMHSITGLPCTPSQDYHALHHRITMHSITGLPCHSRWLPAPDGIQPRAARLGSTTPQVSHPPLVYRKERLQQTIFTPGQGNPGFAAHVIENGLFDPGWGLGCRRHHQRKARGCIHHPGPQAQRVQWAGAAGSATPARPPLIHLLHQPLCLPAPHAAAACAINASGHGGSKRNKSQAQRMLRRRLPGAGVAVPFSNIGPRVLLCPDGRPLWCKARGPGGDCDGPNRRPVGHEGSLSTRSPAGAAQRSLAGGRERGRHEDACPGPCSGPQEHAPRAGAWPCNGLRGRAAGVQQGLVVEFHDEITRDCEQKKGNRENFCGVPGWHVHHRGLVCRDALEGKGWTGGWRRLPKRLGTVTVGYKCH